MLKPDVMQVLAAGFIVMGAIAPKVCAGTVGPWVALPFVAATLAVALAKRRSVKPRGESGSVG